MKETKVSSPRGAGGFRWISLLPAPVCRLLLHFIEKFPGVTKLVVFLLIATPTVLLIAVGWKMAGELRGGMFLLALVCICVAVLQAISSVVGQLREFGRSKRKKPSRT